jgi:hypothetical protein
MTNSANYRTTNLGAWNENRRGEVELDAVARLFLADPEITDRDRIMFALRELRKRGYDVEARPVDWTKPLLICSVEDSIWSSFGLSKRFTRLDRIAQRSDLMGELDFELDFDQLLTELYWEDSHFLDHNDSLEDPYEFTFKGGPNPGGGRVPGGRLRDAAWPTRAR